MIALTQAGANVFTKTFYLAFVAWREARSSSLPDEARLGVMFTLLNRMAHPGWWGNSIATCATKRLQYSSLTDPHDKQLTTWFTENDGSWFNCLELARRVLAGEADNPVPGADSYFDDSIPAPDFATADAFVKRIGTLAFYNVDHDHEAVAIVAAATPSQETDFEKQLRDWLAAPKGGA